MTLLSKKTHCTLAALSLFCTTLTGTDSGKKRPRKDSFLSLLEETENPLKKSRFNTPEGDMYNDIMEAFEIAQVLSDQECWDNYNTLITKHLDNLDLSLFDAEELNNLCLRAAQDGNIEIIKKYIEFYAPSSPTHDNGIINNTLLKALEYKQINVILCFIEHAIIYPSIGKAFSEEIINTLHKKIPAALTINLNKLLADCLNHYAKIPQSSTTTILKHVGDGLLASLPLIYALIENVANLDLTVAKPDFIEKFTSKNYVHALDILGALYDCVINEATTTNNRWYILNPQYYLDEMILLENQSINLTVLENILLSLITECTLAGKNERYHLIERFNDYCNSSSYIFSELELCKDAFHTEEPIGRGISLKPADLLAYDLAQNRTSEAKKLIEKLRTLCNTITFDNILREALIMLPYTTLDMLALIMPYMKNPLTIIDTLEEWVQNEDINPDTAIRYYRRARAIKTMIKNIRKKTVQTYFN